MHGPLTLLVALVMLGCARDGATTAPATPRAQVAGALDPLLTNRRGRHECAVVLEPDRVDEHEPLGALRIHQREARGEHASHRVADDAHAVDAEPIEQRRGVLGERLERVLEALRLARLAKVDELYAKELATTPDSLREYMRKAYFAGDWKPAYEPLVEMLAGWTRHPDYPVVAWAAALTADMIMTQPVVHDFSRIAVPTLLIIGQRDRTALGKDRAPPEVAAKLGDYPALGRRTAAPIPGAKLVELEGVGHQPQVEAFDTYAAALLDFIRTR